MKRLTAALAALALPASALIAEAADLPRRPPDPPPMPMPVIFSWAGPYVGIHGAYGWGEFNRYTFDQNLIAAAIPANYQYANVARAYAQSLPGTYDSHQWGGGFFAGYNFVAGNVVFGGELDYTAFFGKFGASTICYYPDPNLGIVLPGANGKSMIVGADTTSKITDYGLVKARIGYAFDRFLPYAFVGVGGARFKASGYGSIEEYTTSTGAVTATYTSSLNKDQLTLAYGAGAGIDYAITDQILLRAQYDYVQLDSVIGQETKVQVGKIGAGIRF